MMKRHSLLLALVVLAALTLVRCGGAEGSSAGGMPAADDPEDLAPVVKSAAITAGSTDGQKAVVAVDAGFAGNGTTIDIPTGFVASECKFTAAAANVSGSAISTSVSINSTTGEVVCEKVVQERVEVPPETQDCVASYTIICVHEVPE